VYNAQEITSRRIGYSEFIEHFFLAVQVHVHLFPYFYISYSIISISDLNDLLVFNLHVSSRHDTYYGLPLHD
jgi:hypothetical protein